MDYIPSEMLRGHLDTIILLSLADSDKHSVQIKEFVEKRSGGQYVLKQGTFYSCLQRIVKQGYVTEYRTSDEDGVRRKFFQLTEKGKAYIDTNVDSWSFSKHVIDLMISADEEASNNATSYEKSAKIVEKESEKAEKIDTADDASIESEFIPVIDDTDLSSIDYTQAETFFSKNPQGKTEEIKEKGFEQLSFEEEAPFVEDNKNLSASDNGLNEEDDRNDTVELINEVTEPETAYTETPAQTIKEEVSPAPYVYETKKSNEDNDNLSSLDSSVDYRTILEGIFPSHKSNFRHDPREMTYEEGVDVEKFFNETDNRRPVKKAAPQKSAKQTRYEEENTLEKIKKTDERAERENAYDFTDIQNLADEEGFSIRISSNENKKDIGRILINKLNLFSSLIIFGIYFFEALLMYLITGSAAELKFTPYLIFIGVCAVFPIVNAIIYFVAPNKKTRKVSSFKNAIELIIIVCLNLLLIDVVCCVLGAMDFSSYMELTRYLLYPMLFVLTLPFYVIARYLLLERNSFYE